MQAKNTKYEFPTPGTPETKEREKKQESAFKEDNTVNTSITLQYHK